MTFKRLDSLLNAERPISTVVAFCHEKTINWQTFIEDVKALTFCLTQQKEQRWAICCDDSYYFCIAFFASACAGKKIVLPGNHQPEVLNSLSNEFDAMLHDGQLQDYHAKKQLQLPITAQELQSTLPILELSQVSITLFTSGSSGLPKAIAKKLTLLDNEIQQLEANWGELLAGKQVHSTVSHQHIYGLLFRLLWPLCAGRAFARNNLIYPEQVVAQANDQSILISSPALLKRLQGNASNKGYRAIFSSGGPLPFEAATECQNSLKELPIEVFGSTETGGIAFRQQKNRDMPWFPLDGIQLDSDSQQCLRLKSPWIEGDDWYSTTDKCQFLTDKTFILKGRIDKVVKIEEKRVSLLEVELHLNELQWIKESVVLLLEKEQRSALGALLVLSEEGIKHIDELGKGKFWILLRQQLRSWIEPVAIPRYFRVLNEIPVNTQGKRSHTELINIFLDK